MVLLDYLAKKPRKIKSNPIDLCPTKNLLCEVAITAIYGRGQTTGSTPCYHSRATSAASWTTAGL